MHMILALLLFSTWSWSQKLVFIGDSLTEGYGLSLDIAYPKILETMLKKDNPALEIINGGVSGATTASAIKRIKWFLKSNPTHVIIFLGANDGLRGLNLKNTKEELKKSIEYSIQNKLKVFLVEMKLPHNYGVKYRNEFEKIYSDLSKQYQIDLIPFPLEKIGGKEDLNLSDGIHPNEKGHQVMAEHFYKHLKGKI